MGSVKEYMKKAEMNIKESKKQIDIVLDNLEKAMERAIDKIRAFDADVEEMVADIRCHTFKENKE